jgi:hypothetical protein
MHEIERERGQPPPGYREQAEKKGYMLKREGKNLEKKI